MTRVAFVRHGRASVAENLCIGHTDAPLSPEGADSIRALMSVCHPELSLGHPELSLGHPERSEGSAVHQLQIPRGAFPEERQRRRARDDIRVVSSDLRRAMESATIIADVLGCDAHHDRRLREMHFGDWDGRSWTDIEHSDGERLREWMDQWVNVAPPGGESAADVAHRAAEWIEENLTASDESIVVVSHAGWVRAALCRLLDRDLSSMFEIPVDHARATIVDVTSAGCTIVAANAPTLVAIESRSAPPAQVCQPSP